jgi:ATP/ADP translocase
VVIVAWLWAATKLSTKYEVAIKELEEKEAAEAK